MFKIGDIEIKNPIVIAPMAGISNNAFREICYKFGAGLVYAEMVSDKAIVYENEKSLEMTYTSQVEHPIAMQLFGGDVDTMVQAAKYLDTHSDCDIIDINLGCPVTKIVKGKAGSYLLKDMDFTVNLVKAVVDSVKKPVTVKMRLGWSEDSINCIELGKRLEAVGVKAIALHGRTRSQLYQGKANWDMVKKLKESVSIPVIGNGDVKSAQEAIMRLKETGCDGIMIGRGAIGNPFLIKELSSIFEKDSVEIPRDKERLAMCMDHAERLCALKGERIAMKQMRGLAPWYIQGLPYSTKVKNLLTKINSLDDLKLILDEYELFLNEKYEKYNK